MEVDNATQTAMARLEIWLPMRGDISKNGRSQATKKRFLSRGFLGTICSNSAVKSDKST
jgi:hypothetical protein